MSVKDTKDIGKRNNTIKRVRRVMGDKLKGNPGKNVIKQHQ